MASGGLRDLLARLGANGHLLRIRKAVDPRFELAAVTTHVQQRRNLPVLFENVKGTRFPVVSNLYGNYAIVAGILGTGPAGARGNLGRDDRRPARSEPSRAD